MTKMIKILKESSKTNTLNRGDSWKLLHIYKYVLHFILLDLYMFVILGQNCTNQRSCIAGKYIWSWNIHKKKISKINKRLIELLQNIRIFGISQSKLESFLTTSAIQNNLFV